MKLHRLGREFTTERHGSDLKERALTESEDQRLADPLVEEILSVPSPGLDVFHYFERDSLRHVRPHSRRKSGDDSTNQNNG